MQKAQATATKKQNKMPPSEGLASKKNKRGIDPKHPPSDGLAHGRSSTSTNPPSDGLAEKEERGAGQGHPLGKDKKRPSERLAAEDEYTYESYSPEPHDYDVVAPKQQECARMLSCGS